MTVRDVDYRRWVRFVEERKGETTVPAHARMIDCFIEHMVSERSGEIDRFMRTMVDDPVYRSWGRPRPAGAAPVVRGRDEIKARYKALMARPDGFPQFELETERFFVGDDGIAMDGTLRQQLRGSELGGAGVGLPDAGSPDDVFVVSRRMALFVSYRDGLMCGEDCYYDATATVEAT